MNELKNISKLVKTILEQDERTRNSDDYLYVRVIDEIATKRGYLLGHSLAGISITTFLLNREVWDFPSLETVGRVRRKVQEEHPELRSTERVRKKRSEREAVFRGYAHTHNVTE